MQHIDPGQALILFLGNLPTLVAVLLAWMHSNSRNSNLNARMSETNSRMVEMNRETPDSVRASIDHMIIRIDDMRDLLRADFWRVEEVWMARLKHLEEQ